MPIYMSDPVTQVTAVAVQPARYPVDVCVTLKGQFTQIRKRNT